MTYSFENRFNTGLGCIDIEVLWEGGKIIGDPNKFCMHGIEEDIPLGEPIAISDISGEPAYVYRCSQIEIGVTREELYRLLRINLQPDEFLALFNKFGIFHEIHEDFYTDDGIAVQPRIVDSDRDNFFYKCMSGEAEPTEIGDYVEQWHENQSKTPLNRFLGMTKAEYESWVVNPGSIYKSLFEKFRAQGFID